MGEGRDQRIRERKRESRIAKPDGSFPNIELRTLNSEQDFIEIPSYEEVKEDTKKFNEAFRILYKNQDPFQGKTIVQKHGNRFVIQYPPPLPYDPLRA